MSARGRIAAFFLGWVALFFFLSAGYVDTVDAEPSLATARALLDSGTFATHPEKAYNIVYARAADWEQSHAWYTKVGIGMPFLYLPALLAGRMTYAFTGWDLDVCERFFISQVNGVLSAVLLTLVLVASGISRSGFLLATALGFGTLLLPYAKTCHREPALALFLTLTFLAARRRQYWLAGIAAALVFLVKNLVGFAALPILISAGRRTDVKAERRGLCLPLVVAAIAQSIFQWRAFGSIWKTGYAKGVLELAPREWPTPLLSGIWLQLFSWEHGLLFYSPLIFVVVSVAFLYRRSDHSEFRSALISSILVAVCLHARWPDPSGGDALGPRYLVPILPLFFFLLPPAEILFSRRRIRCAAWVLVLCASVPQIVHTSVKAQQYGSLQARSPEPFILPHWQANFLFFKRKWNDAPEIYNPALLTARQEPLAPPIDLTDAPTLAGFNFWWSHIRKPAFASLTQPNQNPQP